MASECSQPPLSRRPLHRMTKDSCISAAGTKTAKAWSLGDYEVVERAAGYGVIRHKTSGETMHSVNNPSEEARRLYIEQPGIATVATMAGEPLTIWDVGLGAATNAMECIGLLENTVGIQREVRIVSFENDLNPLRLTVHHPDLFQHTHHVAPKTLLEHGRWRSSLRPIEWLLLEGQFLDRIVAADSPDIIWYDPFSFKVNTELWSVAAFEAVLSATHAKATRLYTYSASTAVRATMLMAGWFVGRGAATGPKSDTTIAYSPEAIRQGLGNNLLDGAWLSRWKRSDAKGPIGTDCLDAHERVLRHPQFATAN